MMLSPLFPQCVASHYKDIIAETRAFSKGEIYGANKNMARPRAERGGPKESRRYCNSYVTETDALTSISAACTKVPAPAPSATAASIRRELVMLS